MSAEKPVIVMCACTSSNIESHGYCAATKRMAVKFKNGSEFHYADVSPEKYSAFVMAKSKGSFFHAKIRSAHKASVIAAAPKVAKPKRRLKKRVVRRAPR